jgi:hypothetical protein
MEIVATDESVPAFIWILPSLRENPSLNCTSGIVQEFRSDVKTK